MGILEEIFCLFMFLFGVPGGIFVLPVCIIFIAIVSGCYFYTFTAVVGISLILLLQPVKCQEYWLYSWPCIQIIRYFSFKIIYEKEIECNKPYILVAPPHGVFPIGNILTMMAFPCKKYLRTFQKFIFM